MSSFDFLKRFWAWSLSLIGLVGGYLALQQAKLGWLIFPIAGLALVLAFLRPGLEALARLRRYSTLVSQLSEAQVARREAEDEVERLTSAANDHFEMGVVEGRAQIRGMILGLQVQPPELIAIGMSDGQLVLTARVHGEERPAFGARFELQVAATSECKGVAEVEVVDESGLVHLKCVSRGVEQFWLGLERRAYEDPSPPRGVVLAPTVERFLQPALDLAAPRFSLDPGVTAGSLPIDTLEESSS